MKKLINYYKNNKLFLTVCFTCCCIMILCTAKYILAEFSLNGDDLYFHCARIIGVADGIRGGQFPIKYYNNWLFGAAYLGPIFYGDFFLLFPALLVIMGISLKTSYVIYIYIIYFSILIAMYFLAKKYLKNKIFSIICATIFSTSQYIFVDLFFRSAIGESLGIIFFIILLIGIYNMLYEDYSKPWILSIAFIGLFLCHMTMLIISAIVLIFIILFNFKKLLKSKKFYINSLIAFGLFLAICLYAIVSFAEMYFSDVYNVSYPWTYPSYNRLTFKELFGFKKVYSVGIIFIVPFVLRLFLIKLNDYKKEIKCIDKLIIISIVIIYLVTKYFPWEIFDYMFSFIQFPWRLLVIAELCISLAVAMELKILFKSKRSINMVISLLMPIMLSIFCVVFNNKYLFHNFKIDYNSLTTTLSTFEWNPRGVVVDDYLDRNIYNSNGESISYEREEYTTKVTFCADSQSEYYVVPIIYYKGYSAYIKQNDERIKLNVESDTNAMIKIHTKGLEGEVYLFYKGTILQNITFILSNINVMLISCYVIYHTYIKKKINKKSNLTNNID